MHFIISKALFGIWKSTENASIANTNTMNIEYRLSFYLVQMYIQLPTFSLLSLGVDYQL